MLRIVYIVLTAVSLLIHCSYARDIKGGFPDHFPPFSIAGEQVQGIIPDLLVAMNQHGEHVYHAGPYARNALKMLSEGQLDFLFDSQSWSRDPDNYYWSDPIAEVADIVVIPTDSDIQASSLQQFIGLSQRRNKPLVLATRYEYVYPTLDSAFQSRTLSRHNYYSDYAMLRALVNHQQTGIDGIVISELVYDFLVQNNPSLNEHFRKAGFVVDIAPYQFRFPKTQDGKLNMLLTNQVLLRLHARYRVAQIVEKYTQ